MNKPAIPRANYGADEVPRRCKVCGSPASEVTHTRRCGIVILRYRRCLNCGARRCGREPLKQV